MTPFISFVIPVRNDAARLDRCLESIRRNRYPRDHVTIVVADNGSTDESVAVARSHGAVVLELPGLRPGELRNRGAAEARGDLLAFADADHEIGPGWIECAVAGLADERIGAVGAPYRSPQPGTWVQQIYDRLHPASGPPRRVEWLGSGNLAIRRETFRAAGGFDPSLQTCEDVDLCRKLRLRGLTILSDPRLHSVHHGNPETLGQIFLGESWRGRDNLRVTVRPPRTWRSFVSAGLSVGTLLAAGGAVAGLVSMTPVGRAVAAGCVAFLLGVVVLRTLAMARAGLPLRQWPGAAAIAVAYEAGRAVALVARMGYGRRRRMPPGPGAGAQPGGS